MPQYQPPGEPRNADKWEVAGGPERMVPWTDPDLSAAWVWTLRNKTTGEARELSVRVSWRGFESVDDVASAATRTAFETSGKPVCPGS